MSRPLRIQFPDAVCQIMNLNAATQATFVGDADHQAFLDTVAEAHRLWGIEVFAYCLMGNHYHLLVETPKPNLSFGMRQLNGIFTQSFNRRHKRVGHLFQGRFKAILVDKDAYLLELCRYIVLNPVRVKGSEKMDAWKWSSYRATAGLASVPPFLSIDWLLGQFGTNRRAAQKRYREFVREGIKNRPWGTQRPDLPGQR